MKYLTSTRIALLSIGAAIGLTVNLYGMDVPPHVSPEPPRSTFTFKVTNETGKEIYVRLFTEMKPIQKTIGAFVKEQMDQSKRDRATQGLRPLTTFETMVQFAMYTAIHAGNSYITQYLKPLSDTLKVPGNPFVHEVVTQEVSNTGRELNSGNSLFLYVAEEKPIQGAGLEDTPSLHANEYYKLDDPRLHRLYFDRNTALLEINITEENGSLKVNGNAAMFMQPPQVPLAAPQGATPSSAPPAEFFLDEESE